MLTQTQSNTTPLSASWCPEKTRQCLHHQKMARQSFHCIANGDIRRGTVTTHQAQDLHVTSQHFSKGVAGACLIGTGSENAAVKDRVTHARPQQVISSV